MVRKGVSTRFQFFLLLAAGLTILIFLTTLPQDSPSSIIISHPYFRFNFTAEEPEIDPNQLCLIPRIHPFHPSIWRYLSEARIISCTIRIPTLSYIDRFGWLRLNRTALDASGYKLSGGIFVKTLKCSWFPVLRGGHDHTDDDTVVYGDEAPLSEDGVPLVVHEVVMVTCRNFAGVPVYENIHAHIRNITSLPPSPEVGGRQPPNVLLFGLDSLSRQAFIRLLPKTYRYLTQTIGTYVFTGMNKVGDNTFPNLVALLTGKPAYGSDLKQTSGFDDWPLIWRNYSDVGYVTLWAEDFPDYGLFNYLAKGFRRPPVHHYLRPFWLAVKNSAALRGSSHMCFVNTPRHQLQLDYVLNFVNRYSQSTNSTIKNVPYFGFSFLAELSHEYISQVGAADEDFVAFFKYLYQRDHLKNTLMIVMSDHGHRFDAIRSTEVGRLEERLPFFALSVPQSVLLKNPHASRNLESNRGRLTTPFDIHATLVDFLEYASKGMPLGSVPLDFGYGRTLFGHILRNRTCETAGIPTHYCTCEPEIPVSVDDLRVRVAVRVLFNRVNRMLQKVKEFCIELFPGSIISAQLLNTIDNHGSKDIIRVTVAAVPSDAIFEATVEVRTHKMEEKESKSFRYDARVLGDISRINKYGDQSSCIRHDIYRKYCFCHKNTHPPNSLFMSYSTHRTIRNS